MTIKFLLRFIIFSTIGVIIFLGKEYLVVNPELFVITAFVVVFTVMKRFLSVMVESELNNRKNEIAILYSNSKKHTMEVTMEIIFSSVNEYKKVFLFTQYLYLLTDLVVNARMKLMQNQIAVKIIENGNEVQNANLNKASLGELVYKYTKNDRQ